VTDEIVRSGFDDPTGEIPLQLGHELFDSLDLLELGDDFEETVSRLTNVARHIVPGCDFCSVSAFDGDEIKTVGATDPRAQLIDEIQYDTKEGPCWVAATELRRLVITVNTAEDERWPKFSRRTASEVGVFSMMACRLVTGNPPRAKGAVNYYGAEPGTFSEEDQHLAILLAAVTAVVLDAAEQQAQLTEALETRSVIGQAMGILMAQSDVTAEAAFDQLRAASQRMNMKLRDLAQAIAESTGKASS
jgi:GAF domain-containing protein